MTNLEKILQDCMKQNLMNSSETIAIIGCCEIIFGQDGEVAEKFLQEYGTFAQNALQHLMKKIK
jgi:hypothetical protein